MAEYISFQPSDFFNPVLWTGTGSSNDITGVGFQPDWVWIKLRSGATTYTSRIFDAVRGVTKTITSQNSGAEATEAASLSAFLSDGFTVVSGDEVNQSGGSYLYVSWNWLANGQGSSNTDGSINSTYTSANTTSGFSIVQYTGTGSNATIGHGLGVVPKMIWVKKLSGTGSWTVYNNRIGNTRYLQMNGSGAQQTGSTIWNDTTATSSVFSVGTDGDVNGSGATYIAYCFADIKGYSKIGKYVGNGNADGSFVYTGFRPAFIIFKRIDSTGDWLMFDRTRSPSNVTKKTLEANDAAAEGNISDIDMLSNGFKLRYTDGDTNASGGGYIYSSFAEFPIVSSNSIPGTAR